MGTNGKILCKWSLSLTSGKRLHVENPPWKQTMFQTGFAMGFPHLCECLPWVRFLLIDLLSRIFLWFTKFLYVLVFSCCLCFKWITRLVQGKIFRKAPLYLPNMRRSCLVFPYCKPILGCHDSHIDSFHWVRDQPNIMRLTNQIGGYNGIYN